VASKRKKSSFSIVASLSRRTGIVWAVFLGGMTTVTALLLAMQNGQPQPGFLLTSVEVVGNHKAAGTASDSIFQIATKLDQNRWSGIAIHHSGEPAGDADSINRQHVSLGYQGLGYHFLIGNGNGLGDGVIHVGYRWNQQQPGAHVLGRTELASHHNQRSIAICLVGNGDRRSFTERQMTQLANLVQRLQSQLNIPADQVYLHRDLVPQTTSPGKLFSAAQFREQLLD
jgi:hypothetical protein